MTDLGKSSSPARNHPFDILPWNVHCMTLNRHETTKREPPPVRKHDQSEPTVTNHRQLQLTTFLFYKIYLSNRFYRSNIGIWTKEYMFKLRLLLIDSFNRQSFLFAFSTFPSSSRQMHDVGIVHRHVAILRLLQFLFTYIIKKRLE